MLSSFLASLFFIYNKQCRVGFVRRVGEEGRDREIKRERGGRGR
jgi:hypothetical protein